MTTLSQIASEYSGVPQTMRNYEHTDISELLGIPLRVLDFALVESKNTEKYSNGNTKGVFIAYETVPADGSEGVKGRFCTHAKGIVRIFSEIVEKDIDIDWDSPITIKRISTKNGMAYTIQ